VSHTQGKFENLVVCIIELQSLVVILNTFNLLLTFAARQNGGFFDGICIIFIRTMTHAICWLWSISHAQKASEADFELGRPRGEGLRHVALL